MMRTVSKVLNVPNSCMVEQCSGNVVIEKNTSIRSLGLSSGVHSVLYFIQGLKKYTLESCWIYKNQWCNVTQFNHIEPMKAFDSFKFNKLFSVIYNCVHSVKPSFLFLQSCYISLKPVIFTAQTSSVPLHSGDIYRYINRLKICLIVKSESTSISSIEYFLHLCFYLMLLVFLCTLFFLHCC